MNELNNTPAKRYLIAVDFDGTIVTHRYPKIGEEIPGAVETLKQLIRDGHQLILWSVRERSLLDEALQWCTERGLTFYSVNSNFPEERDEDRHFSRKLQADIFIDDRSLGGLPPWETIYQMISKGKPFEPAPSARVVVDDVQREMMERYSRGNNKKKGGGLFSRFK